MCWIIFLGQHLPSLHSKIQGEQCCNLVCHLPKATLSFRQFANVFNCNLRSSLGSILGWNDPSGTRRNLSIEQNLVQSFFSILFSQSYNIWWCSRVLVLPTYFYKMNICFDFCLNSGRYHTICVLFYKEYWDEHAKNLELMLCRTFCGMLKICT